MDYNINILNQQQQFDDLEFTEYQNNYKNQQGQDIFTVKDNIAYQSTQSSSQQYYQIIEDNRLFSIYEQKNLIDQYLNTQNNNINPTLFELENQDINLEILQPSNDLLDLSQQQLEQQVPQDVKNQLSQQQPIINLEILQPRNDLLDLSVQQLEQQVPQNVKNQLQQQQPISLYNKLFEKRGVTKLINKQKTKNQQQFKELSPVIQVQQKQKINKQKYSFKNEMKSILGIQFKKWKKQYIKTNQNIEQKVKYQRYIENYMYKYKQKQEANSQKELTVENLNKIQTFYIDYDKLKENDEKNKEQIDTLKQIITSYKKKKTERDLELKDINAEIPKINKFNRMNRILLNYFLKFEYPKILYSPYKRVKEENKDSYGMVAQIIRNLKLTNPKNFENIK